MTETKTRAMEVVLAFLTALLIFQAESLISLLRDII
jgi:hypothetical protein